jgi:hypothetical protein
VNVAPLGGDGVMTAPPMNLPIEFLIIVEIAILILIAFLVISNQSGVGSVELGGYTQSVYALGIAELNMFPNSELPTPNSELPTPNYQLSTPNSQLPQNELARNLR